MRFSFLLFSACALISYSSAVPIQNHDNTSEEMWQALKAGITQIYRGEPPLNNEQRLNLVAMVQNYCTKSRDNVAGTKTNVGEELYKRLNSYLEEYLEELFENAKDMDNKELLLYYATKWTEYHTSSEIVDQVFDYLNRHWVHREQAEGREDVHEVSELTLIKWREHVLKPDIIVKLIETIFHLFEYEPNDPEIINAASAYTESMELLFPDGNQF